MTIIAPRRDEAILEGSKPNVRTARFFEDLVRVVNSRDPVCTTVTSLPFTVTNEDVVIVRDVGSGTINLPTVTQDRRITIKKTGSSGTLTISPFDMEQIDGSFTKKLTTQYDVARLFGESTWHLL